jgi:hypothetical protein
VSNLKVEFNFTTIISIFDWSLQLSIFKYKLKSSTFNFHLSIEIFDFPSSTDNYLRPHLHAAGCPLIITFGFTLTLPLTHWSISSSSSSRDLCALCVLSSISWALNLKLEVFNFSLKVENWRFQLKVQIRKLKFKSSTWVQISS